MDKLPRQLKWAPFVNVLEKLGYRLATKHPGTARTFVSDTRVPDVVTFHEPHGKDHLRHGTLSEYLRKLEIDRNEFADLLDGISDVPIIQAVNAEDQFRRTQAPSGEIISNCMKCYGVVAKSMDEAVINEAESQHPCYIPELS